MSGKRHRNLHRMRRRDETPHLLVLLIARRLGASAAESEGSSRGAVTDSHVLLMLCLFSHIFALLSCANVWISYHEAAQQVAIDLTFVRRLLKRTLEGDNAAPTAGIALTILVHYTFVRSLARKHFRSVRTWCRIDRHKAGRKLPTQLTVSRHRIRSNLSNSSCFYRAS